MTGDLPAAWQQAQLGELAWVDEERGPDAAVVVPLVADGRPAVALPYADLATARSLARTGRVTWTLAVPSVSGGVAPIAATAEVVVTEDPRGERFTTTSLLEQLLAKHPPARARLDSPLLRREHRWYLARLLVETVVLGPSFPLGVGEGLGVGVCDDGGPWVAPALRVALADGTAQLAVPDGPALVLQHGADVPELETPWHRRWRGSVRAGRFHAHTRDERPPARRRPSLRERLRAERELARACRAGLRESGES